MISAKILRKVLMHQKQIVQPWRNKTIVFGVLSLAPCYVRKCRYVILASQNDFTLLNRLSSLAWVLLRSLRPPALGLKRGRTEGRKREKFYIYSDVTHTHTRPEPGQPERQEEEKATHEGQKAKNSAGGEGNRRTSGTNLHGETDLTKTAHTPKPHDTLRRGTRGN